MVLDALVALGRGEVKELLHKRETVHVQCEFCKHEFTVAPEELQSLIDAKET